MDSSQATFRQCKKLCRRSESKQLPLLKKLSDCVYEFYSPSDATSVNLEIVFFHGLEPGAFEMAYVETWTSFEDSTATCWPQTLLAKDFPRARILSVSYDSSIKRGVGHWILDLFLTADNLLQDLIDGAKVAANSGLPVILVGKDLGGLVIKAICMQARTQNKYDTFMNNLQGVFYYRTPHLGIENLPTAFTGALAERLKLFNKEITRLNSDFRYYRKSKWRTGAIISLQESDKVPELVISESSQRYDVDEYYTATKGNIDTVCKCQAKTSSTFKFLTGFISRSERGLLQLKTPSAGGTTEDVESNYFLDFEDDKHYVPMETTVAAVRYALQSTRTRTVVLHGGPGTGKTSLARYLALQYAAEAQEGTRVAATCSTEQSYWLPNAVVYMTCGDGAEVISMQRELLRKFNISVSYQENSRPLEGAVELQKMYRKKLVDHLSKLQLRVVVVLDDVWNGHLLENLLVPGDRVKYLLTTQYPTVWNAHDSKRVQMQDVTKEDALRIIGNYAEFKGGVISEDIENVADEIVVQSGSHPLALATLGVVLRTTANNLEDWQELKDGLTEQLKTEEYRPSCFGHEYGLSVHVSMIFVLEKLDQDAKQLLYQISLFDGPLIPESLLQLFLRSTLPKEEKMSIFRCKLSLVANCLVQIETNEFGINMEIKMGGLRIHSLRQHFILTTKEKEIYQITDFLDNDNVQKLERSDLDLATALCAIYGATYVKQRALKKMGWSVEHCRGLASALKPFLSLMLGEGGNDSHISQAATVVFWNLLIDGSLDDYSIDILLCMEECIAATCQLLDNLIFTEEETHPSNNGGEPLVSLYVANMRSTFSRLVTLLSMGNRITCANAVLAIRAFAVLPQNRVPIVQFPSCLERLVALLAQDVEASLQESATSCFTWLVDCDVRVDMLATPFLLERLVSLLSKDMGGACRSALIALSNLAKAPDNRVPIVQFPSCLERLVALLAQDVEASLQESATSCFTWLVDCDVRVDMLAFPFLLERLVSLLSKDMGDACKNAVATIRHLAEAPDNRVLIVQFPSCLERLVALLAQDVEQGIQEKVRDLMVLLDCDVQAIRNSAIEDAKKGAGKSEQAHMQMQETFEELAITTTNCDATLIPPNTKSDCENTGLVEKPHSSVREGEGSKMLKLFVKEIRSSRAEGYFLRKKWLLTLDEHESELLKLVLGRNGYLEIYQTRTTVFYERAGEHVQVLIGYDDPSYTPENIDLCFRDKNRVEAVDDCVPSRKFGQTRISATKHNGDFLDSDLSTLSLDSMTQSAAAHTSGTSPRDSPNSLLQKRERPLAYSNEMFPSLIRAVKESSLNSYTVSTHLLGTLDDRQIEYLNSALSEAGYAQIYKTSRTTYFERIQGRVRSCPIYETDTVSISGRNRIGSDTESLGLFQRNGKAPADDQGSDVGGKRSFVVIEESPVKKAECLCAPLRLSVSNFDLNLSPSGPSSSSQGKHSLMFSSRLRVGDCYVSLPKSRKGHVIATEVDKDISMKIFTFTDAATHSEENVSVKVSAGTSLSCCLRRDCDNKKIKIEFSKIRGEAKMEESAGSIKNALALGSVRINVHACIVDRETVEDFAEISLSMEEEYNCRPWRRELDGGVWIAKSSDKLKDSELESLTLELNCDAVKRMVADRKACSEEARRLSFVGPPPVIMEGDILEDLSRYWYLQLQIRYQVLISLPTPCGPLRPAGSPIMGTIRRDPQVFDFDGVLKISTEDPL